MILNMFCSIAFISSRDLNKEIFKYFLIKSICDAILFSRNTLNYIADNCGQDCILITSHTICYIRFGFYYFVGRSMILASMIFSVAASFNRFRKSRNTFLFFNKIPFWFKLISIFLYSFGYYWYIFTGDEPCRQYFSKSNTTYYSFANKIFRDTTYGVYLELFHSIIRDCVCLVLIIVLNILTLIFLKVSFARKRDLTTSNKSKLKSNNLLASKAQLAEKKLTLMVAATSIINIFGHILLFIFYFPLDVLKKNFCLKDFANLLLYISLAINFFIYYAFNKHFSNYVNKIIQKFSCGFLRFKDFEGRASTINAS